MTEPMTDERLAEIRAEFAAFGLPREVDELLAEVERLRAEQGRELARADKAEADRDRLAAQVKRVRMLKCWTNEDGSAFVFADDLRAALDGEVATDA